MELHIKVTAKPGKSFEKMLIGRTDLRKLAAIAYPKSNQYATTLVLFFIEPTSNMNVEIYEGSDEENLGLVSELFVAAMSKELNWASMMRDVKVEDWLAWQLAYFKLRWKLPDKRLFFAKEVATG